MSYSNVTEKSRTKHVSTADATSALVVSWQWAQILASVFSDNASVPVIGGYISILCLILTRGDEWILGNRNFDRVKLSLFSLELSFRSLLQVRQSSKWWFYTEWQFKTKRVNFFKKTLLTIWIFYKSTIIYKLGYKVPTLCRMYLGAFNEKTFHQKVEHTSLENSLRENFTARWFFNGILSALKLLEY